MNAGWVADAPTREITDRLLAERLNQSLELLAKWGVSVPPTGRHLRAVQRLRAAKASISALDERERSAIENAHRTAWETFLITVATDQRKRKLKDDLFTHSQLSQMMHGAEVEGTRSTEARDIQFELLVGAELQLGGVDVFGGEPDLRFKYGYETVGLAAKRVRSTAAKQLEIHIAKAVKQIHKSALRGWIALNIDSRLGEIELGRAEVDLIREFDSIFDSVHQRLDEYRSDPSIIGFMIFGYASAWLPTPTSNGEPRLHTVSPVRRVGLIEDAGEELLFGEFLSGWESRLNNRLRILSSPEFNGIP